MSLRPVVASPPNRGHASGRLLKLNEVLSVGMNTSTDTSTTTPDMQRYKSLFYASTVPGLIETDVMCNRQMSCVNPQLWKEKFRVATTWSPEPERGNMWAFHIDNAVRRGTSEAFLKSVYDKEERINATYAESPNEVEKTQKLSDLFREAVYQVMHHRLLFGGEYVDINVPYGYNNVLPSLGVFFFAQVSTFLSRKNGSIAALVRMIKQWKKSLPTTPFNYQQKITSDIVEAVFREAVRLAYHPTWNSNTQNVDDAARQIKASWEETLNKRARIQLGFEDDNLSLQFQGLSHENDSHAPEIGSRFPLKYSELQDNVPVFDFITSRIASGGVPSMWILATIDKSSKKQGRMDRSFLEVRGDANNQKVFGKYRWYLVKLNGLPKKKIDDYTKFMVLTQISYTFLRAGMFNGSVVWELVPVMKYSETGFNWV